MSETHQDIRDAVRVLCDGFPGEYWRKCDRDQTYPTEFVKALTDAGFLAVLIPEKYGGSGLGISEAAAILGEIHQSGCNGGACHAARLFVTSMDDAAKARGLSSAFTQTLRRLSQ